MAWNDLTHSDATVRGCRRFLDYRRYLAYHQIYHQQFIHPDQYRILGLDAPSRLRRWSMQAAQVLDGVFRRYVKAPRECAVYLPAPDAYTQSPVFAPTRIAALTPTELKVLLGVIAGRLNKQIAFHLGISEATVKGHMTSIMRKLGVHNRTQVVIAARALDVEIPD